MSDRNLKSFVGPEDNNSTVDISETFDAGQGGYSSALKFSVGLRYFFGVFQKVIGGRDACVDVNNLCQNLSIYVHELQPTGQFAITCKGGSKNVTIGGGLTAHGKDCDVMLDDWSDQSHAPTENVVLNITSKTGNPVRVRAMKNKPHLQGGSGPYTFVFPQPWINPRLPVIGHPWAFIFETLRRWGFFRAQSNANTP